MIILNIILLLLSLFSFYIVFYTCIRLYKLASFKSREQSLRRKEAIRAIDEARRQHTMS